MIDGEKVGVGIITCNRKESYKRLLDSIKLSLDVDLIASVKNLKHDYSDYDPQLVCNVMNGSRQEMVAFQVDEKLGIAHNKNLAAKWLLEKGAQHIFIIEDDILLKDYNVFKQYVMTAREFHLEHLNFCRAYDGMVLHEFLTPFAKVKGKSYDIELFSRLCGDFSYFTSNALQKAGLYDEGYINALDHCEHTYRMSQLGFYTPFYAFADIAKSTDFLEDVGKQTTIEQSQEQKQNISNAFFKFMGTYGKQLNQIKPPTQEEIVSFLKCKTVQEIKK